MTDRIDPDYDPSEKDVEDVIRLIAAATSRIGSIHYGRNNGNGFSRWMLAAALALFVAGVTAIAAAQYSVVQRLSVLEAKVEILVVRK